MTDNEWPLEADFTHIRPMTEGERKVLKSSHEVNKWRKCVSCGNASKGKWCGFCLEEE